MLGRWWHAVFALALVLSSTGAATRAHATEGRSEVLRADALPLGGAASVKRTKTDRGAARAACRAEHGVAPAPFVVPPAGRTWVRLAAAAAPRARCVVPPRTASARAPPA